MTEPVAVSATLADVAREARVSIATASRVLSGGARMPREDLRERVLAAASALHYAPNAQAQAMARGRSNLVGLVVHDIADPYFSSIAAGVMRAAESHGLIVTISSISRRPDREPEYLNALRGQRACAAILAGSRLADEGLLGRLRAEIAAFEATGGRVAAITQDRLSVDTVVLENRSGAEALAHALIDLGHRRFGVLAGPPSLLTSKDRLEGFRRGLADAGVTLPAHQVLHGDFTRDGGYTAMSKMLETAPDVGCVFAVNDVMAVGAMAALRDAGVSLPQGMAVAGFDDIITLRDVTPSLTTVRLPLEEIGAAALDLVTLPKDARIRVRRVQGEVVLRESTRYG